MITPRGSFLTAWTRSPSMTQEFAQVDVSVRVRSVTRLDLRDHPGARREGLAAFFAIRPLPAVIRNADWPNFANLRAELQLQAGLGVRWDFAPSTVARILWRSNRGAVLFLWLRTVTFSRLYLRRRLGEMSAGPCLVRTAQLTYRPGMAPPRAVR
jgi:hypothetical protein